MKEEVEKYIGALKDEERHLEKELKQAVDNQRWSEVLRLAQNLCESRSSRWLFEAVLERAEKSNQKQEVL